MQHSHVTVRLLMQFCLSVVIVAQEMLKPMLVSSSAYKFNVPEVDKTLRLVLKRWNTPERKATCLQSADAWTERKPTNNLTCI